MIGWKSDDMAKPVYSAKAKLVAGTQLYTHANVTHDAIAELAGCHQNTVRTALQGRSKQYLKAHDIFTAINQMLYNGLSRADHVHYFDEETKEYRRDSALEKCLVFPQFAIITRMRGFSMNKMAEKVGVDVITLTEISRRRPVDARVVEHVFEESKRFEPSLDDERDLIR